MLHGVLGLAENSEEAAERSELAGMMRNVNELTRIAEKEMHAVILSCVHARREALKRTVH